MSHIDACFSRLQAQGRRALIPYITAGDPSLAATRMYMDALVEAGADIIELGIPFSDPMADGPVIQRANERALLAGASVEKILLLVQDFKLAHPEVPVVLMGYLNPIIRMGIEQFAQKAGDAKLDGLLIVDLPPEENASFSPLLKAKGIDQIFLASPTTTDDRLTVILEQTSGYLYYVALKGVTGARAPEASVVTQRVHSIKERTPLPVAVGFGIKDGASASALGEGADAVICGSALVDRIGLAGNDSAKALASIKMLTQEIRQSLDAS